MLAKAGQPYGSRSNLGLKRVPFLLSSTFVASTDSSLSSIESRDDDTAQVSYRSVVQSSSYEGGIDSHRFERYKRWVCLLSFPQPRVEREP